jgi:putative SOS response-associated peptidase YedK
MCGRFVSSSPPAALADFFGAAFEGEPLRSNFNVAPTNDVYGVIATPDGNVIQPFQWGLVPSWAKDVKIGSKMINARAETILEKPSFKGLVIKHRLIIPMDGFYEWRLPADGTPTKTPKTPMFIHRADGAPLAVAGLWARWRDRDAADDAPWLHTCTVITTSANRTMAPVHNRMPVILPASSWDEWLDPANRDGEALHELMVPAADDVLVMHEVSTSVNNVRNKGPELAEPV